MEPSRGWYSLFPEGNKSPAEHRLPVMSHSVAELQAQSVAFELEPIDHMYLNCNMPQLISAAGVAGYFRYHKGRRFVSTKDAVKTSEAFRRKVFEFAKNQDVPVHRFAKGERKDDVMLAQLKEFPATQGVASSASRRKCRAPSANASAKAKAASRGSTAPRPW